MSRPSDSEVISILKKVRRVPSPIFASIVDSFFLANATASRISPDKIEDLLQEARALVLDTVKDENPEFIVKNHWVLMFALMDSARVLYSIIISSLGPKEKAAAIRSLDEIAEAANEMMKEGGGGDRPGPAVGADPAYI